MYLFMAIILLTVTIYFNTINSHNIENNFHASMTPNLKRQYRTPFSRHETLFHKIFNFLVS